MRRHTCGMWNSLTDCLRNISKMRPKFNPSSTVGMWQTWCQPSTFTRCWAPFNIWDDSGSGLSNGGPAKHGNRQQKIGLRELASHSEDFLVKLLRFRSDQALSMEQSCPTSSDMLILQLQLPQSQVPESWTPLPLLKLWPCERTCA